MVPEKKHTVPTTQMRLLQLLGGWSRSSFPSGLIFSSSVLAPYLHEQKHVLGGGVRRARRVGRSGQPDAAGAVEARSASQ